MHPKLACQIVATNPKHSIEELDKLYPKDLELKQVIIIHRHGERSPLVARFLSFLPASWDYCKYGNQFSSEIPLLIPKLEIGYTAPKIQSGLKFIKTAIGETEPNIPNLNTCYFGQLTDNGRYTLMKKGGILRKIYIDYLGFLSPNIMNSSDFYLRSTQYRRTIESMQHLMQGLYPSNLVKDYINNEAFVIKSRHSKEETLYPDNNCVNYVKLIKQFKDVLSPKLNTDWTSYVNRLATKVPEFMEIKEDKYQGNTSVHRLFDSITSALSHRMSLPKSFTPNLYEELNRLQCKLWFGPFKNSSELSRLSIGRFLSEIKGQMINIVNGSDKSPKMAIYSGHDTTLGPLLIALDVFDDKWPPYASMVFLELFKDKSGDRWYVRCKYNDQILIIPNEKEDSKFGSQFIAFDQFVSKLDQFIPKDYTWECGNVIDFISDK